MRPILQRNPCREYSVIGRVPELVVRAAAHTRLSLLPHLPPYSVYERQWVLPHPTARVKVLKWVKATNRPPRSFPEEEDARYVYASSSSQQQATSSSSTGQTDVKIPATAAASTSEPTLLVAAGEDVVMDDASLKAEGAAGSVLNAAEGTQGQHLFDETQVEPLVPAAATADDADAAPAGAGDISMTPAMAVKIGEAAAEADQAEDEEAGEAEDVQEEDEDEEEVADIPQKHQTIRIGGPLPEDKKLPPSSAVTAAVAAPEEAAADAQEEAAAPVVPTPQVDSELHPPLDGVPPSDPLAEEQARQETSAPTAEPTADAIEADPASGVNTGDPAGEADNIGGVEVVSRDDPEVKGLGEDVAAIVHAQPDGVEQVKVVED